ncbi:pyridine nucleotide-disulfide oxidoreductase [Prauserella sp. PE36]|uniref:NAD(P)/FAD-dependent oxidoreductase n=1 Tax=Prauserella sp. PE36 TaxID=1504709 RepID=UPI000D9CA7AD|nr:NAD(P)/FAD-dependent oxidoreductase [Prauserella sp. PE36]PXY28972.1 pyridine nucleotide-disulfide oxidoreductase [Prauserella coralliicola]RBM14820.1 pyridine nucleotide-disulfide oxidoreductase [Prauserella sp. PE36]
MSTPRTRLTPEVAIVGGGPAGLRAASELAPSVTGDVLVLEREHEAGGIPRHCDHTGFGIRDLHRVLNGPNYARRLVRSAEAAGAVIRTDAMVTGWTGDGGLEVTTPEGLAEVHAKAIVLATGARERPRTARMIPGDRPDGVYTTGMLQNLVHLHHREVGKRAVIVGSELVSWSAVLTLRHGGCRTVLMTSEHRRPEAYAAFTVPGRLGLRVPVRTRTRVARIIGRGRVEAVEIEDLDSGSRDVVECDTVVFTGDWIPDNELVRAAGLPLDGGTCGPVVDSELRTARPGLFAAGNVVHPVDTADVAALDGVQVATSVLEHLAGRAGESGGLRIVADEPLRWVSPMVHTPSGRGPTRGRLLAWTDTYRPFPRVTVRQAGEVIARRRVPWPAAPGRVFRIPGELLDAARPDGGELRISLG